MPAGGGQQAVLLVAALLGATLLVSAVVVAFGLLQRRRKSPHRVGGFWGAEHAEVVEWSGREGMVSAGGELWRARSAEELRAGDDVKVLATKGLVLDVAKRKAAPAAPEEGE